MTRTIYHNGILHTGFETLTGHILVTEGSKIAAIQQEPPVGDAIRIDLKGGHLAPSFIDLQIYGGNDRLFADHPSVESIKATYAYCRAGGATHFQPTMGTQSDALMEAAIDAVAAYQAQGLPGVIGLHLEGPYINPMKRGAHIEAFIQTPQKTKVADLLKRAGRNLSMMTVAPERCSPEVILQLQQAGVVLSAGHSNATYEEALRAFALGIPSATHLFNAMSPMGHRAPGMVGALLDSGSTAAPRAPYVSIVADGHHVAFPVIRIAKRLLGDRLFLITDAVTENQTGAYRHRFEGNKYVMPDGTLSGSALTMMKAVRNCVEEVGIPLDEALRMASLYPARLMGLNMGTMEPGKEAAMVWFDDAYTVLNTFAG